MKHTHKANCQICGALQAASVDGTTHRLPKHGYRVAGFGFFVGTCQGSGFAPLQESRVECDRICAALADHERQQLAMAAAVRAGTLTPKMVHTGHSLIGADGKFVRDAKGNRVDAVIPFAEATAFQQSDACKRLAYQHDQEARGARGHITMMQALAAKLLGQPLVPAKAPVAPVEISTGTVFTWQGAQWRVTGHRGNSYLATRVGGQGGEYAFKAHGIRTAIRNAK